MLTHTPFGSGLSIHSSHAEKIGWTSRSNIGITWLNYTYAPLTKTRRSGVSAAQSCRSGRECCHALFGGLHPLFHTYNLLCTPFTLYTYYAYHLPNIFASTMYAEFHTALSIHFSLDATICIYFSPSPQKQHVIWTFPFWLLVLWKLLCGNFCNDMYYTWTDLNVSVCEAGCMVNGSVCGAFLAQELPKMYVYVYTYACTLTSLVCGAVMSFLLASVILDL